MTQKFFISFNSKPREKAHWTAWTLRQAGHAVALHDWEIPAGAPEEQCPAHPPVFVEV